MSALTGVLVTEAAPESPDWFQARREGITGTDLPKILGLSQYGNALSVWLGKRGELEDDAGEAAMWGNLLEDIVANEWARREGFTVEPIGVLANTDEPWMRASLDRIVTGCVDGGCMLEVKTRSAFVAADWREEIPDDVLAQVQWGLAVSGFHHAHIAALIGGQRLESHRVDADAKVIQYLYNAARPVWEAVEAGVPPEAHPDSEGVLLSLLDRMYSRRAGDRDLDPDKATPWLQQYAEATDMATRAAKLKTEAKTALVQLLEDGDCGLVNEVPVFTYRSASVSDRLATAELRALRKDSPELYDGLKSDGYITTTQPRPTFRLTKGES